MRSAEEIKADQEEYAQLSREDQKLIRSLHRIPKDQLTHDQALLLQRMSPIQELSSSRVDPSHNTIVEEDSKENATEEDKEEDKENKLET